MNATTLKLIAVVCMTLDHLSTFPGAPLPLRYIGRFAAVIFFFCAAESVVKTHDRRAYMKRLYKMSLLMSALNVIIPFILDGWFPSRDFPLVTNNIFSAILSGVWFIDIWESTKNDAAMRKRRFGRYLLYQILIVPVCIFCTTHSEAAVMLAAPLTAGSILCSEGGLLLTVQIILFYFWRDSKKKLAVGYTVYCALYTLVMLPQLPSRVFWFVNARGGSELAIPVSNVLSILGFGGFEGILPFSESLLQLHFQCFMIFALPLLLLYNGKRGKGCKRFFYIYYPAHIFVLYIIGVWIRH